MTIADRPRPEISAVVLAGGGGTRMNSSLPKPLQTLCGAPMLAHVLDSLSLCEPSRISVVVSPADGERIGQELRERASHLPWLTAEQPNARGTGDAAAVGLNALPDPAADPESGDVIILPGDAPLLRPQSLSTLLEEHLANSAVCTMLTAVLPDPTGYGRVVRNQDASVRKIVEQADASPEELSIREVATSVYVIDRSLLKPALGRLRPDNAAGEIYLTDIVEVFTQSGHPVAAVVLEDPVEAQGVNTQEHLAYARAEMRRRVNARWMRAGVEIRDPSSVSIDTSVDIARGVTLLAGVILEGRTSVGEGALIGPYSRLLDCQVGAGAVIEMSVCEGAEVAPDRRLGPFEHLKAPPPPATP